MSEAATVSPAPRIKARYVLQERLGVGGQGEVWRAHDPQRGEDIGLKILRPPAGRAAAAWDALRHEYESACRLDHPFILKVYEPERDDATFLLPMELARTCDACVVPATLPSSRFSWRLPRHSSTRTSAA